MPTIILNVVPTVGPNLQLLEFVITCQLVFPKKNFSPSFWIQSKCQKQPQLNIHLPLVTQVTPVQISCFPKMMHFQETCLPFILVGMSYFTNVNLPTLKLKNKNKKFILIALKFLDYVFKVQRLALGPVSYLLINDLMIKILFSQYLPWEEF